MKTPIIAALTLMFIFTTSALFAFDRVGDGSFYKTETVEISDCQISAKRTAKFAQYMPQNIFCADPRVGGAIKNRGRFGRIDSSVFDGEIYVQKALECKGFNFDFKDDIGAFLRFEKFALKNKARVFMGLEICEKPEYFSAVLLI